MMMGSCLLIYFSQYDTELVLMAAVITCVVTLGLTLFALQTKVRLSTTSEIASLVITETSSCLLL